MQQKHGLSNPWVMAEKGAISAAERGREERPKLKALI